MTSNQNSKFSSLWYDEKLRTLDQHLQNVWNALSIRERRKFLVFVKFQELQRQLYKAKTENKNNLKGNAVYE
jgi:hypothetical protein